jgi:hypothetical protein
MVSTVKGKQAKKERSNYFGGKLNVDFKCFMGWF